VLQKILLHYCCFCCVMLWDVFFENFSKMGLRYVRLSRCQGQNRGRSKNMKFRCCQERRRIIYSLVRSILKTARLILTFETRNSPVCNKMSELIEMNERGSRRGCDGSENRKV
jgi:hypothetical protein